MYIACRLLLQCRAEEHFADLHPSQDQPDSDKMLSLQFTEPSGVAVNAQNDIIVADTNNHRIQVFDKEGRFKFQFGECGKRDGQLLYPNRCVLEVL